MIKQCVQDGPLTMECSTDDGVVEMAGTIQVGGSHNIILKGCEPVDLCQATFVGAEGGFLIVQKADETLAYPLSSEETVLDICANECERSGFLFADKC